jgi:hypothetical protein
MQDALPWKYDRNLWRQQRLDPLSESYWACEFKQLGVVQHDIDLVKLVNLRHDYISK